MIGLVALALLAAACGSSSDSSGPESTTTVAPATTSTTPPPTVAEPVSWADPDEIAGTSPEQVLPPLEDLVAALAAENTRLGATDGLRHDLEEQVLQVQVVEAPCTQIAYATFYFAADLPLTEAPEVGLYAPGMIASVCVDGAAAADETAAMYDIADREQGTCPVDEVGPDGLGVRVCTVQPGEELSGWTVAAAGTVDRVLVEVTGLLGPGTDPQAGAESALALLDLVRTHIDERLG